MPRQETVSKPDYRFVVVDASIYTWRVKDKLTGTVFAKDYHSSMDARIRAEELNINPELVSEETIES